MVYLGRAWGNNSWVMFANTFMDKIVSPRAGTTGTSLPVISKLCVHNDPVRLFLAYPDHYFTV